MDEEESGKFWAGEEKTYLGEESSGDARGLEWIGGENFLFSPPRLWNVILTGRKGDEKHPLGVDSRAGVEQVPFWNNLWLKQRGD